MRKILVLCCIILLFVGCVNRSNRCPSTLTAIKQVCNNTEIKDIKTCNSSQKINEELCINTGNVFFKEEIMKGKLLSSSRHTKFYGVAGYFELVVSSVLKNKLTLDYSEYILNNNDMYSYMITDDGRMIIMSWLKRTAFDKSFEYDISESKTICFKTYQFEITKIENGSIFYIRKK